MRIFEFFSGTQSIASVFRAAGHEVFTFDNLASTNPSKVCDIMQLTAEDVIAEFGKPEVIWASPPCEKFSIASIGKYWNIDNTPKNERAAGAKKLVEHTVKLIQELNPKYAFIENPRGKLRKLGIIPFPIYTVSYCQYGETRMKPTDIWTNHPNPNFKPICKNGDDCHVRAPRGSQTGTQGMKGYLNKSKIPKALAEHILSISEPDLSRKEQGE